MPENNQQMEKTTEFKVSVSGKDSHAIVYMTPEQYQAWKEMPREGMEEMDCFEILNKLTEYQERMKQQ